MTVYVAGEEVELHYVNPEEGWGIVQFEDDERLIDVDALQLKASEPEEDIYGTRTSEAVREALGGLTPMSLTPVDVRINREHVKITSAKGDTLYSERLEEGKEDWEIIDEARGMLQAIDMAHRQPTRFLWRSRDKLSQE